MPGGRLGEVGMGGFWCFITFNSITFNLILDPSAYASDSARKLRETLRQRSQNLAIWASQRMLFYPTKTFGFFYNLFHLEISCSFGIWTEETEPLKNFQIHKALNCSSYWENTVKRS